MKTTDFLKAEEVLAKSQDLLDNTRTVRFSWSGEQTFMADMESAEALLSEMRAELSKLTGQLFEHDNITNGQGKNRDLVNKINQVYSLLSHLHNDVHVVKRTEVNSKGALERAKEHLEQIAHHCRTTRDSLSPALVEGEKN